MPQDKFITRKQAGIKEHRVNYMMGGNDPADTASTPSEKIVNVTKWNRERQAIRPIDKKHRGQLTDAYREGMRTIKPQLDAIKAKANIDRRIAMNDDVTSRDATNARIARQRLAGRAAQSRSGRITSNVSAMGPMAGAAAVADALYAADEATGFRRTKYSGNSGGPSFSMNPYASSNKSSYAGQSAMSKAMGVGKKK
jgi:hypothetical protein